MTTHRIGRIGIAAILLAAAAAGAGCGGKKGGSTTPDPGGGGEGGDDSASRTDPGATMVKPETADEIQRAFDRKRNTVSRCLSAAIDAKELPKQSRGKITLNVTVMPGGKAGEIKVAHATLESKLLADCVIGKVREIEFPEVPQAYPTSYTYAFEAM